MVGTNPSVLVRFLSDVSGLMGGISQAETGLAGFASKVQAIGATLTSAGTKLSLFTTVPILGLGAAATKSAVDFDKSMRFINTIAHKTGDEYEQMVREVKQLSVEVPQSATTLAMAVYNIMSAGFADFEDAMILARQSAKMAVAGMTEADIAAKALTGVMNAYGFAMEEAEHVADVLFKGVERGVYTFEQLSGTLGNVIALAAQSNISLEELTAAFESITKAGLDVRKASLGLNYVFMSLIRRTEQQNKAVALLSKVSGIDLVSSFSAAGLEAKGLIGVMTEVLDAIDAAGVSVEKLKDITEEEYEAMAEASIGTGDMMESITRLFPSILALRSVFSLVRGDMVSFRGDMEATANAGGAMGKAFDAAMEATSMQFELFKSRLTKMLIAFGDQFLPAINEGMERLGKLFDRISELDEGTKNLIIKVAGLTAAAGPGMIVAGQATMALGGLLGLVSKLGTGLWGLSSGFMTAVTSASALLGFLKMIGGRLLMVAGPIGLILFLVAALVGNIQDLEGGVGGFIGNLKATLEKLVKQIMDILSKVLAALQPVFDVAADILDMILGPLIDFIKAVVGVLTGILNAILPPLMELLKAIADVLAMIVRAILPVIVAILKPLGDIITKLATGVLAPMLESMTELVGILGELIGEILGVLTGLLLKLIDPLMELVDAILGPLVKLFQAWLDIALPLMELGLVPLKTALFLLEPPLNLVITLIEHIVKAFTWLVDKILGPVTDAISWVVDKVGGFFSKLADWLPFSPAKKGPLSKPVHWSYITEGLAPTLVKAEHDIAGFNAANLEQIPLDEDLPGRFAELNKLMDSAEGKIESLVKGFRRLGDVVAGPVMTSLEKAEVVVAGVADKVTSALAAIPTEIRKGIEGTLGAAVEMIRVSVDWSAFAQGLNDALAAVEERITAVARSIKESLSDALNVEPLVQTMQAATVTPGVRVPVAVQTEGTASTGEAIAGPLGHLAVVALDEDAYRFLEQRLESHRTFEQKRRGQ